MAAKKVTLQNGDKPKAPSSARADKTSKPKVSEAAVEEMEKPKKARSKKLSEASEVSAPAIIEPIQADKADGQQDGPVRKGRRARNPDAKNNTPKQSEIEPKANGKKRAAVSSEATTKATQASAPNAKKAKTTNPEELAAAKPVLNEREVIASLSDVSDDEGDDEEDEGNSSDEDEEDDKMAQRSSMASIKLPNSKDDAVVKQRLDKLKKSKKGSKNASVPGTLYVGRLPKGFFEDQMKGYFSQFGDVTRLRVSRNKKTGASKHYAFVEFADKDVATIVQETMNNYLIDGSLLQVRVVPKDKIHPEMWIGANRKFRPIPGARLERLQRSRDKTEDEQETTIKRTLLRQEKRKAKLAEAGIEYDFPGYAREGDQIKSSATKSDSKQTKKPVAKKAKVSAA